MKATETKMRLQREKSSGSRSAYFDTLEVRLLFSFDPSGREQETLELIQRARLNPQAELPLLVNSTDPNVINALSFFNVNQTVLSQQWATLSAAPPLAWNSILAGTALAHNDLMLSNDSQLHVEPGEQDLGTRISAAGYNYSTVRESIFAFAHSPFEAHAAFAIDWGSTSTGIQNPPGHRENLYATDVREIGISVIDGQSGKQTGPLLFTEDFGTHFSYGNPTLLGVVYNDSNLNGIYTAGEGIGGSTITVTGTSHTYTTTSMTAGGYQLQVPAGIYSVTASGGGLSGIVRYGSVIVGSDNVKRDFLAANQGTPAATLTDGELTINGTATDDTIALTVSGANLTATVDNIPFAFTNAEVHSAIINCFNGADTVTVGSGMIAGVVINGGQGNDTLTGGGLDDTINGAKGGDVIHGGAGNDSLAAGKGNDTVFGDSGNDTILGALGMNSLNGGDGSDQLFANNGFVDSLDGGLGTDTAHWNSVLDSETGIETLLT